jgi:hypothetical protein
VIRQDRDPAIRTNPSGITVRGCASRRLATF